MDNLNPVENAPKKWWHAFLPIAMVIGITIFGLLDTGFQSIFQEIKEMQPELNHSWRQIWNQMGILFPEGDAGFLQKTGKIIGSADSYVALLWASLGGVLTAVFITLSGKIMTIADTVHSMLTGFKTMFGAICILILAWGLAITTEELHTAEFLTSLVVGNVLPGFLPLIVFILSALISFSTGSSWSTMAILYPIVIPTTWSVCMVEGLDTGASMELLLNVISVTLGASVLGDHCSPISDTTILSSLASDCNHIQHVRTQLPYALVVGVTSLVCAGLSAFIGGSWLLSSMLLLGSVVFLYFVIWKFGKPVW